MFVCVSPTLTKGRLEEGNPSYKVNVPHEFHHKSIALPVARIYEP